MFLLWILLTAQVSGRPFTAGDTLKPVEAVRINEMWFSGLSRENDCVLLLNSGTLIAERDNHVYETQLSAEESSYLMELLRDPALDRFKIRQGSRTQMIGPDAKVIYIQFRDTDGQTIRSLGNDGDKQLKLLAQWFKRQVHAKSLIKLNDKPSGCAAR